MVEQFVVWLWGLLQGDMGVSIFSNLPVTRLIAQRLEPTVALTLSTLFVAVALAIPIGVVAAWKARKLVDRLVMGFAVLGFAVPVFVLAYVLIYFFAVQWQLLPVQGYQKLTSLLSELAPETGSKRDYSQARRRKNRSTSKGRASYRCVRTKAPNSAREASDGIDRIGKGARVMVSEIGDQPGADRSDRVSQGHLQKRPSDVAAAKGPLDQLRSGE